MALRKQTSTADKIIFSIENLTDRSNKKKDIYFGINEELNEFNNDVLQFEPRIRGVSEGNASRETANIGQQQQQQRKREQRRHDRRVSKKP